MLFAPLFGYFGDRYSRCLIIFQMNVNMALKINIHLFWKILRKLIMASGVLIWVAATLIGSFIPVSNFNWNYFSSFILELSLFNPLSSFLIMYINVHIILLISKKVQVGRRPLKTVCDSTVVDSNDLSHFLPFPIQRSNVSKCLSGNHSRFENHITTHQRGLKIYLKIT